MLTFDVDDEGLIRALHRADDALERFVGLVAREFERDVRSEAGQHSSRLAEPWNIDGTGPWERHVIAPEWWAHILAHGSSAHGPAQAPRMVFEVDGDMVAAMYVRGISGRHFDEAAETRTRSKVDDILRRLIEEAT